MPPGDPQPGPIGRFAAEVLGIDTAPEDADHATLCRRLLDHDFLPDPLAHQAIFMLAGRPVAADSLLIEAVDEAEGRRLFAEVEEYADGFFDIPVAQRVDRYRRLGLACARQPRLIERLRLLRPGLMLERSAIADPSPLVNPLLDDLFALFPMRPGPRAVEARERSERFRANPAWTDARRTRALRDLARRHPEVVALVPQYPAGLARKRRRGSADRALANFAARLGSSGQRAAWIVAVLAISSVGRLVNSISSNRPPPPIFNLPQYTNRPTPITNPIRWETAAISRQIREDLKGRIRAEVSRIGKSLDDGQLSRVAAGLPVEQLPQVGGLAAIVQAGAWTMPVRDRFIVRLKAAMKLTTLALTDAELDDLAPRCFPEATPRRSP